MKKETAFLTILTLVIITSVFFVSQLNQSKTNDLESSSQQPEEVAGAQADSTESQQENGGETTMTQKKYEKAPDMIIDPAKKYSAVISTSKGDITVDLTADSTPLTVNNFVFLAKDGFYDGVIFHRVIKDFMIQTGDPLGNGTGGPGYKFADEIKNDQEFSGKGILAMANSGPNTNGSQFFITHAETPWLNGAHTIFGKVTDGMDVVDAIATAQTGANDKPVEDILITSIDIIEK